MASQVTSLGQLLSSAPEAAEEKAEGKNYGNARRGSRLPLSCSRAQL